MEIANFQKVAFGRLQRIQEKLLAKLGNHTSASRLAACAKAPLPVLQGRAQ